MSLPVEILRALIASGASAETILAAAEAAEARVRADKADAERKDEERRERAREGNRARQRAWYDRHVRNNDDNAVSSVEANQDNGVRGREVRSVEVAAKGPQTPKNLPEDITPSLPSEAQSPLPAKPRRFDWPSDFEALFWAAYPRHTDRKKAMAALGKVRRADRVAFDEILAGCQRLRAAGIEPQFLPHATTWLNNERWTDEIPDRRPPPGRPPPGQRLSGPTAATLARKQARDSNDEPALNLEPVLRPFPSRRGAEAPAPADCDGRAAEGDRWRSFEGGVGSVLDLGSRRAHG